MAGTARENGVVELLRRIGSAIERATVPGAAMRYGVGPDEYYREPGSRTTHVTRAQAERWRY
jgi:hypothetical protein